MAMAMVRDSSSSFVMAFGPHPCHPCHPRLGPSQRPRPVGGRPVESGKASHKASCTCPMLSMLAFASFAGCLGFTGFSLSSFSWYFHGKFHHFILIFLIRSQYSCPTMMTLDVNYVNGCKGMRWTLLQGTRYALCLRDSFGACFRRSDCFWTCAWLLFRSMHCSTSLHWSQIASLISIVHMLVAKKR